ncbi:MAG TPA: pilus assembly protein PilM [Tepidisphaeraceae bacterium]|jgi:type IV pilus assembly protein PilM
MIRLTRSQVQPIGLDIGFDSVKMLQVEVVGEHLSVLAAARQQMTGDARSHPETRVAMAADLIRQMIRQGGFSGRRVVVALPREFVHVKNLRLPLIPPHELQQAVRFEAKNIFPFDTTKAHIQILPAGEVRQGLDVRQELIVLAARCEDVDGFLEQIHRCGVVPESIDVEPCAVYRAYERFIRRREDEQEVHVIVDVGSRRSQVVIGKGRDITFLKAVEIGSDHLHEAISKKLGITIDEARALRRRLIDQRAIEGSKPEGAEAAAKRDPVQQAVFDATRSTMEDMGREISLCLRYYSVTFRGQRPNKVKLVGGESCDPLLVGVLNAALGIPLESGRPLFSLDTSRMKQNDRRGTMGEWAMALGLGLKTTKGYFAPRDGKARDPNVPWPEPPKTVAEVIDINQIAAEAPAASRPASAPAPAKPAAEEVHA